MSDDSRSISSNLSTSLIKKAKLAPRSSLQFKVGPQFTPTIDLLPIYSSFGKQLEPVVTPRIDRGFEMVDNEWIGYKRNYFTLVCSFHFSNHTFKEFTHSRYYTIDQLSGKKLDVKYFALRLVSKCSDDGSDVFLVQHTAKRDKGPQTTPPEYPAVPSELPDHETIRNAANVRNISKIAKLDQMFYYEKLNDIKDLSCLQHYPSSKIAKVARYERIQFSSSINHKKPGTNHKKFKLYVELVGNIGGSDFMTLAYTETPELIVRGRSPSNYSSLDLSEVQTTVDCMVESVKSKLDKQTTPKRKPLKQSEKKNVSQRLAKLKVGKLLEPGLLDDQDTYEILLSANKNLTDLSVSTPGSMLDTSTPTTKPGKVKKTKLVGVDGILRKLKKGKKSTLSNSIIDSPSFNLKVAKDTKKINQKKEPKPEKVQFPSPSDFDLENFDFNSSIGDIELIDSNAKRVLSIANSFKKSDCTAVIHSEDSHDFDLLQYKTKLDFACQADTEMNDYFFRLHQSNPSEVLKSDFDEGPSFIVV